MKCFNCNKKAIKKIGFEPDLGEIHLCENPKCKEKALNDIERFQYSRDYQGRRKDQVEFFEKMGAYSFIGIMIIVVILVIVKYAQIF